MNFKLFDDRFNRYRCWICSLDLTGKYSIGGRIGNQCVRCYCRFAKIDEGHFLDTIATRRCCQCNLEYDRRLAIDEERMDEAPDERQREWECGRDLAIKPAILWFENGTFRGLLCFRCRYRLDWNTDLENKKKFRAEKALYKKQWSRYEQELGEQHIRHDKLMVEWQGRCDAAYSKWEGQYGVQWRTLQERPGTIERFANAAAVVAFFIIGYLIFRSADKWNGTDRFVAILIAAIVAPIITRCLAKTGVADLFDLSDNRSCPPPPEREPPPTKEPLLPPPKEPERTSEALRGYPELLFDGNKEADLNPDCVYYPPPELFADTERRGPPDWDDERAPKCKQRDANRCLLCGDRRKKNLHAHHIIPKSEGGSHSLQNLVTLCSRCHCRQRYYDHDKKMKQALEARAEASRNEDRSGSKKPIKTPHTEPDNQLHFNFGDGGINPRPNYGETSH